MKKKFMFFTTGILVACIISCGSKEAQKSEISVNPSTLSSDNTSDCIGGYFEAIDGLFTLDMVVAEVNLPKDKAKVKYSKPGKNLNYHSLTYSWEGSRKREMKVGDRVVEVPRNDFVTISGFQTMDDIKFKKVYRSLSAEEMKKAEEEIDKELEKKGATENTKALSGDSGSDLIKSQTYETITGVGSTAVWHSGHNELLVLSGTSKFAISVDVFDDANMNKTKAIALAQRLIEACK